MLHDGTAAPRRSSPVDTVRQFRPGGGGSSRGRVGVKPLFRRMPPGRVDAEGLDGRYKFFDVRVASAKVGGSGVWPTLGGRGVRFDCRVTRAAPGGTRQGPPARGSDLRHGGTEARPR